MQDESRIPPGQQLVRPGRWPIVGEKEPADHRGPWTLEVGLDSDIRSFSMEDLQQLPQTEMELDIHCVTRWSKLDANFAGVLLQDLLKASFPDSNRRFVSFVSHSNQNHSSSIELPTAIQLKTLIALQYEGQPLEVRHGGPVRNIVPKRYFYKSVKWLRRIDLLEVDRLGYWESETGYHNLADPWKQQRYMVPNVDRRTALQLIGSKDFSGRDLRSIDASDRDLSGLKAESSALRDANFGLAKLQRANFRNAILSNAHFQNADLRNADLTAADIEGADFSGADLRGANLTGCSLVGTSFFSITEGSKLECIIDANTVIPDEILTPLTESQLAFIKHKIAEARASL
ncbi:MAG: molybdopterin-dependent oxidoreductase [Planctomycetota bacterium]